VAATETASDMNAHRIAVERRNRAICVIDDDPGVRDSLVELLKAYGFDLLTYASGAKFLGDDGYRRAGCLIIDYHLPDMMASAPSASCCAREFYLQSSSLLAASMRASRLVRASLSLPQ
jgi:hypothetical protein